MFRLTSFLVCLSVLLALAHATSVDLRDNSLVRKIGRFDENLRASWPGAGIKFSAVPISTSKNVSFTISFDNPTQLGVTQFALGKQEMTGSDGFFFVQARVVDSKSNKVVFDQSYEVSDSTSKTITITLAAQQTSYEVFIGKRNEAYLMQLKTLDIENANVLPVSDKSQLKLLFVGDSISAGYGDEGQMPCTYSSSTENVFAAYDSVTAELLQADYHVVAWSGKGLVRNYGDANQLSLDPMPTYYNRTLSNDPNNYWNPSRYTPDAIYLMLGTNDFSTQPVPTQAQFEEGFANFIARMRGDYPSSKIVVACAPMKNLNQCEVLASAVSKTKVDGYIDIPYSVMSNNSPSGCDYHPSSGAHKQMATDYVAPAIKRALGL